MLLQVKRIDSIKQLLHELRFGGVAYHINDIENNGLSLHQIANNFLASPEFRSQYGGNPTDEEYISVLYQNVLNRTAAGFPK